MGHRHTPEGQGCPCAVCDADGGLAGAAVEPVERFPAGNPTSLDCARDKTAPLPRIGVRAALFALRFYKSYLSLLFAGSCRFQPTCSQYAYEAVERFAVARGSWLALKRLLRCQPLSRRFGYDPVPEAPESRKALVLAAAKPHLPAGPRHEVHT
jgi:uncharacterized protein